VNSFQETINATLDANGQLQRAQQPSLPPGPVQVTIRAAAPAPQRGLADVVRELAAEQRARGFPGRSAADIRAEDQERQGEDAERDRELDAVSETSSAR
jgi:hypothetical protein